MSEFVYFTILKKSNVLIYRPLSHAPSKREYRRDVNIMKNKKYNKFSSLTACNKLIYNFNSHRGYSTIPSFSSAEYKNIETSSPERLNTIIKELDLNPVYTF